MVARPIKKKGMITPVTREQTRMIEEKGITFPPTVLKEKIEKMEGHTFVCHGEISTQSKYTDTMEQLVRYATHSYKYGKDVQMLVQTLEETNIPILGDVEKDSSATNERV